VRILVVDDDAAIRTSLKWLLEKDGHSVTLCANGAEAATIVSSTLFDLVFCDVMMPVMGGLETLENIRQKQPMLKVIMISGQADIPTAVKATKLGAYDFMEKPLKPEKVVLEIQKLETQRRIEAEMLALKNRLDLDYQMIGSSPQMQRLRETIDKVAPTEGRVLIFGENGSGKELVAREIHQKSGRTGRFVQLNCAALPKELIESELFGYEKGAFTGAHKRKTGLVEEAEGGTLLLDEVGDMAAETQAKLLRVLQENEFTAVGSTKPVKFNVRVIAATNKNLPEEIIKGTFREDLYFRLNVIPIVVPALRDRPTDIPELVSHFLNLYAAKNGKKAKVISRSAVERLMKHPWPGNVRELRNIIERLGILIQSDEIDLADVDHVLGVSPTLSATPETASPLPEASLKDQLENFEKNVLAAAFQRCGGNVSRLAQTLQTDRANLHKKLKKYGIK
jgi:two-component system, NtrC family, nitrogen regulation response regulator NtrX